MGKIDKRLYDELERFGYICPLCNARRVEEVHHIVPRSHTSTRREPPWLNDVRNIIALCSRCHNNFGQTKHGRRLCIAVKQRRWPSLNYNEFPWGEYANCTDNDD